MNRLCLTLLLALSPAARSDDYPQWLGPARDNVYREPGVTDTFPAAGPRVIWRTPVGGGYSQVAVAGKRVIVTDRVAGPRQPRKPGVKVVLPGTERVRCLDDETGKELWKVEYDCPYGVSYATGPRTTPTIDGDRVYALGAEGDLHCLDLDTGAVRWRKKLEGKTAVWGYAGSPVIEGDKLILLSSGQPLLTALDKQTGAVIWTALEAPDPGYVPPTPMTLAGKRQIVQYHPSGVAGIDPTDGKVLWQVEHGPERNGVTIVTPVQLDPDTFLLASSWNGMAAVRVAEGAASAKILWRVQNKGRTVTTLHPLHSQVVLHEGLVYGVHQTGALLCTDPKDGRVVWNSPKPLIPEGGEKVQWGTGFLTPWRPDPAAPARHFFLATDTGDLIVCRLSATGYTELSRAHLLDPTNTDPGRPALWCHPAYAHRSVYWRNDKELVRASLAP